MAEGFDPIALNARLGRRLQRAARPLGLAPAVRRLRLAVDARLRARAFDRACQRWDTRVVRFAGLRRSGNHAVLGWLVAQLEGEVVSLNDVEPGSLGPRASRPKPLEVRPPRRRGAAPWLIYGYEDADLHGTFAAPPRWHEHGVWGATAAVYDVLLVRHPLNLFASRLRWRRGALRDDPAGRAALVAAWKAHAREALGVTTLRRHAPVTILFDRWFADAAYRCALAGAFGVSWSDRGLQRVAPHGAGSSFDGRRLDGDAQSMAVLDRWRVFADDPTFRSMIDDEVRALAARLFGPDAPTLP